MSKNWTWGEVYKINIDDLRTIAFHYLNNDPAFTNIEAIESFWKIHNDSTNYKEKLAWFSEVKNKDIIDQFFKLMDDAKLEYTKIGDMSIAVDWVVDRIRNYESVNTDDLYELCIEYLENKGLIKDE
jgi:predicted RNA-binding protein with EMAP domain